MEENGEMNNYVENSGGRENGQNMLREKVGVGAMGRSNGNNLWEID
jgi:hypothetical protein